MEHKQSDAQRRYAFFQHKDCEYFPCHKDIPTEDFNCLFCYCPLYTLGRQCGGACTYTERGLKDCGGCSFPHRRDSYDAILSRFPDLARLAAESKDHIE